MKENLRENIFTEKQYQAIAKAGDEAVLSEFGLIDSDVNFEYLLKEQTPDGINAVYPNFNVFNQEIMAIMNPLTREWAHEQFVKKEKKYHWTSKKKDEDNERLCLYRTENGAIVSDFDSIMERDPLTESEIREWGYNPNMFNREEAESKKTTYSADIDEDLGFKRLLMI